jgi:hypothetical protein
MADHPVLADAGRHGRRDEPERRHAGIVEVLRPLATSPRRGQFFTWLSGMIIFFDDYANTLIVGNTMRPGDGPAARVAREAGLHRRLRRGADRGHRRDLDLGRLRDLADRRLTAPTAAGQTTDPALRRSSGSQPRTRSTCSCTRSRTCSIRSSPSFVVMIACSRARVRADAQGRARAARAAAAARAGRHARRGRVRRRAGADPETPHRWYNAAYPFS